MLRQFADARVFAIDDNPVNIALIVALLKQGGLREVFTETDSRNVLGRLAKVDPDLVILDLHMPYLDGFEVLSQLRAYAPSEYLPVLVITADVSAAASERALGAGAQDFVTKPFNNAEILLRVRSLLSTRFMYTTLRGSIMQQADDRVSEVARMNQALEAEHQTVERLQALSELNDTLMKTVSHDLRSPIAAVLVMTQMLSADTNGSQPLPPEMRQAIIAKMGLGIRSMDHLLTDLLDSDPTRVQAGRVAVCDVGELVKRVLADTDLGIEHPVQVEIDAVELRIDPVHVERIVANLLANADQHLAPGVAIWVRVEPADGGVLITVEDAGPGVAKELAMTIFEPFQRGSTAASGGLGLGLSLVSRFAQLDGGRAWVENRAGGGASFKVFLPPIADVDLKAS